jgi:TolA-binding protein
MPTPPRIFYNRSLLVALALIACEANSLAQNAALEEQRKRSLIATTYNEANADFAAGKFADAATKLEKVIGMITDPNEQQMLAPIFFTLGAAYFNVPNYPKAIETFKAFLQKYPGNDRVMEVRLSLAQSFLLNKNYKEATDLYEQLERIPTLRDKAIAAQVQIYKEQDKKEMMVKMMEKLGGGEIKSFIQARGALQLSGYYSDLDQPDDALRVLNKVVSKPEFIDNLIPVNGTAIKLGDAFAEKRRFEEAIRTYRWVKPRAEVIRYSKDRISLFERRIDANNRAAAGNPQAVTAATLQNNELKGLVAEQQALLAEFEKTPDYAPALLFRQARAWYEWEKKWEAVVCYDRLTHLFPKAEEAEQALYGIVLAYADLNQARLCQQACERYIKQFPDGPNAGTVGYLSGAVSLQVGDPKTAETFFGIMIEKQPNSQYREDMMMLVGHAKFMQGRWEDARKDYEKYLETFASGKNKEEVSYRIACIDVFTGKYEDALKKLDIYLTAYPNGEFRQDAKYRIAVCYYAAQQYDDVAKKCEGWIAEFPKDPMLGEVLSLLGDALAAQDKNEAAAYAYERSYKAATTDEVLVYSIFEASKQMQKAGKWEALAAMFEEFVKKNPEHQAAVAGMYWIGRAKSKMGKTEEAKAFLSEQLTKYLNEPKRETVESLLNQLAQLCLKRPSAPPSAPSVPAKTGAVVAASLASTSTTGSTASTASTPPAVPVASIPEPPPWDPFAEFERLLAPLDQIANATGKARLLYARGDLFELKRQPDRKTEIIGRLATEFKPEELSPVLLGRVGDYILAQGDAAKASTYYNRLKEDFLRSEYLDFAYTGLGDIAFREKNYDKSLELYDTALEKIGATFKLKEATLGKARTLIELARYDEAKKLFEQVASIKEWRGDATAEAVYQLGEIEFRQGRFNEAIAHYRRVFVAYQKFLPWVARAYLRTAESFDKAGKRFDGIKNLQEMMRNEKLNGLPETEQARALLQRWEQAAKA